MVCIATTFALVGLTSSSSTSGSGLIRSLADFAKLVELFDAHQVSFVSVTQVFNTNSTAAPRPRSADATQELFEISGRWREQGRGVSEDGRDAPGPALAIPSIKLKRALGAPTTLAGIKADPVLVQDRRRVECVRWV